MEGGVDTAVEGDELAIAIRVSAAAAVSRLSAEGELKVKFEKGGLVFLPPVLWLFLSVMEVKLNAGCVGCAPLLGELLWLLAIVMRLL